MDRRGAVNSFIIPGRLPGANEVIFENRRGWQAGARLKKDTEALIRFSIRDARKKGKCWPVVGAAAIHCEWQERNRLRDLDNIFSSIKFVLDAMKSEGLIKNDSQRYVRAITNQFVLGDTDQVTVTIELMEGKTNDTLE